jgi:PIN domain nuclease of toxin-antitoxin system
VNLLLDTHVLLWWLADDSRLSPDTRKAISDPENIVLVSAVTIWEIVIKKGLGKLAIPDEWYDAIADEPFQRLPITWEHSRKVADLPELHRDPFDRLLVAQAIVENLVLVTGDEKVLRYDISVVPA